MTLYPKKSFNIKLKRIFNIFNRKLYIYIYLFTVFILCAIIAALLDGTKSFVEITVFALFGVIILIWGLVCHCPKTLSFSDGVFTFSDYVSMKPKHVMSTNFFWLKVDYTVCDIKEIKLYQNKVEKFFNVGRITFSGKATFSAKRDLDRIKEKNVFTIYGIKNFNEFKLNFYEKANSSQQYKDIEKRYGL